MSTSCSSGSTFSSSCFSGITGFGSSLFSSLPSLLGEMFSGKTFNLNNVGNIGSYSSLIKFLIISDGISCSFSAVSSSSL